MQLLTPNRLVPQASLKPILAPITEKAVARAAPISTSEVPSDRWMVSNNLRSSVRLSRGSK